MAEKETASEHSDEEPRRRPESNAPIAGKGRGEFHIGMERRVSDAARSQSSGTERAKRRILRVFGIPLMERSEQSRVGTFREGLRRNRNIRITASIVLLCAVSLTAVWIATRQGTSSDDGPRVGTETIRNDQEASGDHPRASPAQPVPLSNRWLPQPDTQELAALWASRSSVSVVHHKMLSINRGDLVLPTLTTTFENLKDHPRVIRGVRITVMKHVGRSSPPTGPIEASAFWLLELPRSGSSEPTAQAAKFYVPDVALRIAPKDALALKIQLTPKLELIEGRWIGSEIDGEYEGKFEFLLDDGVVEFTEPF